MSPEQAATVTPGQAAYEASGRILFGADHNFYAWDKIGDTLREAWEAAAQAAIETATDWPHERDRLTERVAELVTEGNELRALAAEVIDAYDAMTACDQTPGDEAQLAGWRQRAGLEAGHA